VPLFRYRLSFLLDNCNSTPGVSTLVSDEKSPDAIDETTHIRVANDKWVFRLVESSNKSESFVSISLLCRCVCRYSRHCSSGYIMHIRRQRPVSYWRLARSHAATVPFAVNEKTNDGPAKCTVNCPGTGRAQRAPSESGNIRDHVENGFRFVSTACITIFYYTTTVLLCSKGSW